MNNAALFTALPRRESPWEIPDEEFDRVMAVNVRAIYRISRTGDDCLLIGTDYGHTDTSSDVDAIVHFRQRTDISELSKHKIISDNPRR